MQIALYKKQVKSFNLFQEIRYNLRKINMEFSYCFRHKFFLKYYKNMTCYKKRHIFFYFFFIFRQKKKNTLFFKQHFNDFFFIIPKKQFLLHFNLSKLFNTFQFDFCYTYFFIKLWNFCLIKKKNFITKYTLDTFFLLKNQIKDVYNFKITFINQLIINCFKEYDTIIFMDTFIKNTDLKQDWIKLLLRVNRSFTLITGQKTWKKKKGVYSNMQNQEFVIREFFKKPINFLNFIFYCSKINFLNFLNFFLIKRRLRWINSRITKKKLYLFLLFRFPKVSIRRYKYYFNKKRFNFRNLPIFGGMRYRRKFSFYRGVFLTLGHYKFLPSDLTYTGFKIPYLTTQNKKAFWRPIVFCFKIYSYIFINTVMFSFVSSCLHRLNLYTNFSTNFGWVAAIRTFFCSHHRFRYISRYYFFGKRLLAPMFYSQIPFLSYNIKTFFREYFSTRIPTLVKFKRHRRLKRPINIRSRQINVMRRIRQNLFSLFCTDKKRSWYITQFCSRFYRRIFTGLSYLYKLEMALFSIILRSRIAYTIDEAFFLIQNGLVFINGIKCTDVYTIINCNDRIQLVLSKALHLYHRNELSIANFFRKKIRSYVLSFKTRSRRFKWKIGKKSWPLKHIWFNYDIPRYLEVDYLTMTIFVLYLPLNIKEMFTYNFLLNKFLTSKCYNWRFHY